MRSLHLRRFRNALVLLLVSALMPFLYGCGRGDNEYDESGMKFYELSGLSYYDFISEYDGPEDAYLCSVGETDAASITVPSEYNGKPVVALASSETYSDDTVTELIISEGIMYIEGFYNYSALTRISFPSTLRAINRGFNSCSGIASLELPDGVSVRDSFRDCENLQEVTFLGDVTEITRQSFVNCGNLTSVCFNGGIGDLSEDAFTGCYSLTDITGTDLIQTEDGSIDRDITEDEWAYEILSDAVDNMISSGDVYASDISPDDLFLFDADGYIVFSSAEAGSRYTGDDYDISGEVLWGSYDPGGTQYRSAGVSIIDNASGSMPFADSPADCDTLILYAGLVSGVNQGFYEGGTDRRMVSTIVLVIDVSGRQVIHIEQIGVDCPGVMASMPSGRTMSEEALEYMSEI